MIQDIFITAFFFTIYITLNNLIDYTFFGSGYSIKRNIPVMAKKLGEDFIKLFKSGKKFKNTKSRTVVSNKARDLTFEDFYDKRRKPMSILSDIFGIILFFCIIQGGSSIMSDGSPEFQFFGYIFLIYISIKIGVVSSLLSILFLIGLHYTMFYVYMGTKTFILIIIAIQALSLYLDELLDIDSYFSEGGY